VLCERAGGWLGEAGKKPWFAIVSLEAPHPPYAAPAAGVVARPIEPPAKVPPEARARAARELSGYFAHIEATDRAIGRLLGAVPSDTMVVFTSVHGDMHGAHGLFRKGWPHEESVRVPLLVRHPVGDQQGVGVISDEPVSLLDLREMALSWSEGRTWRSGRDHAVISMPSVVALPDQCDRVWRGVRTPTRKCVFNADGSPWLYFDLEADPGEERNLVDEPDRAKELAEWSRRSQG